MSLHNRGHGQPRGAGSVLDPKTAPVSILADTAFVTPTASLRTVQLCHHWWVKAVIRALPATEILANCDDESGSGSPT